MCHVGRQLPTSHIANKLLYHTAVLSAIDRPLPPFFLDKFSDSNWRVSFLFCPVQCAKPQREKREEIASIGDVRRFWERYSDIRSQRQHQTYSELSYPMDERLTEMPLGEQHVKYFAKLIAIWPKNIQSRLWQNKTGNGGNKQQAHIRYEYSKVSWYQTHTVPLA